MITCKVCGSLKVENKEKALCATHNREARKAPAKIKPKTPLKKVSTKKAAALVKLAKTKVKKREEAVRWCEGCGRSDLPLSHSHILSVANYPHLEADPENLVYECYSERGDEREYSCHTITEVGTLEMQESLSNWPKKLRYILKHAPEHLEKIKLRSLKKERL